MQATTDVLALHARAIPVAQQVIDGIRPEQMTAPTPCADWDVRALLNHLIGFHRLVAAGAAGQATSGRDVDFVGDDPTTAFADAAREASAALRAPGGLERTYRLPWGEMPGEALARPIFADTMIHAWDLARATGQPTSLDPDLCEAVLAWGRTVMKDEYRQPGGAFGAEVPVPADAPACDRLAAFYGRRP